MTRLAALLVALLTAASAAAQPVSSTIKFAWDANPSADHVAGYRLVVDGTPTDVGLVTTTALTLPSGPHQATVVAYWADGTPSPPSTPLVFTSGQPDPCTSLPLTLVVSGYTPTVTIGNEGTVTVKALGPSPVTLMEVLFDAQVVGSVSGQELRFLRAIGFGVPRTSGQYNLFVFAKDSRNCTALTTAPRPLAVQ